MTEWESCDPSWDPGWLQLREKYPWLTPPPYPDIPPNRLTKFVLWLTDRLMKFNDRQEAKRYTPSRGDHNDRDHKCIHWWGDRGGYDLRGERCGICNPLRED